MKFSKVMVLVLALIMMAVTLVGCDGGVFLTNNRVDKLVKDYGTPTMQVVLEYELDDEEYTLILDYELALETAPITTINFINLVKDGYYNAKTEGDITTSHFFSENFGSTNAFLLGEYTISEGGEKDTYGRADALDYTIKGEFVQNEYVLPAPEDAEEDITDSNNQFELFSLAMYYGNTVDKFDGANKEFVLTTSSTNTLQYKNYAVFAYLTSMTVKCGEDTIVNASAEVDSAILKTINEQLTYTSTKDVVYTDDEGEEHTNSVKVLRDAIKLVSITMTDDNDYTSLPHYTID